MIIDLKHQGYEAEYGIYEEPKFFGTKDDETFQAVMKSFFYQLAYGNLKRNKNFSEYINNRFNKNPPPMERDCIYIRIDY